MLEETQLFLYTEIREVLIISDFLNPFYFCREELVKAHRCQRNISVKLQRRLIFLVCIADAK
jgi:hypothetical protein